MFMNTGKCPKRVLVEPLLTSCLVWNSDGSIHASECSMHRINNEFVLCSVGSQTTWDTVPPLAGLSQTAILIHMYAIIKQTNRKN